MSEKPGCLGLVLRIFGVQPAGGPAQLPYGLRDQFLSPAELLFHNALCAAVGDRAMVCPKVNLADVFYVKRPNENQAYRNKIDRKHVDFVVCNPTSMQPLVGVELDDRSHQRSDRQARDDFVNAAFDAAGLPLVHVPARARYDIVQLSEQLAPYLPERAVSS